MKLITIGDNVTDCYLDAGVYYPGGQAVNVAVNAKQCGAEKADYLGIFGDDDRADFIRACLEKEGVTTLRCRKVYAHTAQPGVRIAPDGDRIFVGGPRDSCQHLFALSLVREDYDLIRGYDVCHTTNESHIEGQLPGLSAAVPVSFDFSTLRSDEYLRRVCPFLTYGFFSGSGLSDDEVSALIQRALSLGTHLVGVTLGSRGSVFSDGRKICRHGISEAEATDTMGAGDSFIAAFLTRYVDCKNMDDALDFAAERSAHTCTVSGSFGYPHRA